MCVLHTNKTNGQARGHVGTYFQNKAETTLDVSIDSFDEDVSTVKARYSRDEAFKPFAIRIVENIPVVDAEFVVGGKPKKQLKTDISDEKLMQILNQIFIGGNTLGYADMVDHFVFAYKKVMKNSIGKNTAGKILKEAMYNGKVVKREIGKKSSYSLNPY